MLVSGGLIGLCVARFSGELKKLFGFLRVARRSDLYIDKIGIPKQVVLELTKNSMCICNPKKYDRNHNVYR